MDKISNKTLIRREGGITAVIAAMTSYPSNPELQTHACGALFNLASNNEENKTLIEREGGTTAVIAAMTSHPSNPDLQTHACWALKNIIINAENRTLIEGEGRITAVISRQGSSRPHRHGFEDQDWID
jgi:hypothetical protein